MPADQTHALPTMGNCLFEEPFKTHSRRIAELSEPLFGSLAHTFSRIEFGVSRRKNPNNNGKNDSSSIGNRVPKGVQNMHARPEIREILIVKKLRRWALIAKYPAVDPSCPPSRARRNYWRLCAKHPQIASKFGLSATSVYRP
jgi:hypothetical protein